MSMVVMPLPEDNTPRAADNVAATSERGLQFRRDLRAKSETQIQADMAMAKILDMQQGLMNQMKSSGTPTGRVNVVLPGLCKPTTP